MGLFATLISTLAPVLYCTRSSSDQTNMIPRTNILIQLDHISPHLVHRPDYLHPARRHLRRLLARHPPDHAMRLHPEGLLLAGGSL